MEVTTFLKMGIMLVGMAVTFGFFISGFKHNDPVKKNRAGILFACTCVLVLIVSVIEFAIYYKF